MTEHLTSLGHVPDDRWAFDEEVTGVFDDMLERSIPQYSAMRGLVFEVGRSFVRPGTQVVDLGCSHGAALAPFVREFGSSALLRRCRGFPTDAGSRPQPLPRRDRGRHGGPARPRSARPLPLRRSEPHPVRPDPPVHAIEHRPRIVRDVYRHTVDGGAFVLVEKVLGGSRRVDGLLTELHHGLKRASGYTQEEIDRKRLSLEGVLVPVAAAWNEDLLRGAGFRELECFWRCLNFAAWVAVKDNA